MQAHSQCAHHGLQHRDGEQEQGGGPAPGHSQHQVTTNQRPSLTFSPFHRLVFAREVGGSMAPLWKNMIESGKTQIIYCVDASAPERVGQATINLIGKTSGLELGTRGITKVPG